MNTAPLTVACHFSPADQDNYQQLLGALDYSFLCAYAIGMYLRWVCFVCEPLASAEGSGPGRVGWGPPAVSSQRRDKCEPTCGACLCRRDCGPEAAQLHDPGRPLSRVPSLDGSPGPGVWDAL